MRLAVVAVPEGARSGVLGQVAEGVGDQFDGGGGVGGKDEVVVGRVCAEEAQGLQADGVDGVAGELGGLVC